MKLSALIRGNKNAVTPRPATATVATLATVEAKQTALLPSVATVAKVAVAATEPELYRLIEETLSEIDRQGRPWTGWRQSLTQVRRQRLKEIERRIDSTYGELDRPGLLAVLDEYREICRHKGDMQND